MSKRKLSQVNPQFNCEWCSEELDESYISLACGFLICEKHLEVSSALIDCLICKNHSINVEDTLNLAGNLKNQLKKKLCLKKTELDSKIRKIEEIQNDPKNHINELYSSVIRKIDLRREELKMEIDSKSDNLIDEIKKLQEQNESKLKVTIDSLNIHEIRQKEFSNLNFNENINTKVMLENVKKAEDLIRKLGKFDKENFQPVNFVSYPFEIKSKFGELISTAQNYDNISSKTSLTFTKDSIEHIKFICRDKFLTYSKAKGAQLMRFNNEKICSRKNLSLNGMERLLISERGSLIKICSNQNLEIFDSKNLEKIKTLTGHSDVVLCANIAEYGRIISGSKDKTIKIWDELTGECIKTFSGHENPVSCVKSIDSQRFASGCVNGNIRIWCINTGECLKSIQVGNYKIVYLEMIDSNKILTASSDFTIKIWEINEGVCLNELKLERKTLECAKLLSTTRLITKCSDGKVKLWSLINGKCLKKLKY